MRTAFKKLYDLGLIYRGERIVNWDPVGQTTISDEEVVYRETTGTFYYFKYGPFTIATARPETKFRDKYLVMHPDDERYAEYQHGDTLSIEWIDGPVEATILKDEIVDPTFGTGVMTITPWHSQEDFDLAEKYHLEKEPIIGLDGRLLPVAGQFAGQTIEEAREKIVAKLEEKGLLVKREENYVHQLATASAPAASSSPRFSNSGSSPSIRNSNQVAGKQRSKHSCIRPCARRKLPSCPNASRKTISIGSTICVTGASHARSGSGTAFRFGNRGEEVFVGLEAPEDTGWEQDPDTLDTWFSSGLWTFSTLGWPEKTADLETYHPTTLLETGYDILFFWVARMILFSECLLGEVPFKTVYLHGLVRDDQGRKLSKSLGNAVDPLEVIEVYGTDALRLALTSGTTPGNDVRLSDQKIEANRNFANKLWNIARYAASAKAETPEAKSLADRFILEALDETILTVTQALENYQLSIAIETLRAFTWDDFADWYIEIHKLEKNDGVLRHVLDTLLRLWHPFMPFVTEALFQQSNDEDGALLMGSRWPQAQKTAPDSARADFEVLRHLVTEIRNLRATYHLNPKTTLSYTLTGDAAPLLTEQAALIEKLVSAELVQSASDAPAIKLVHGRFEAAVFLPSDFDRSAERARLEKEQANLTRFHQSLAARLENSDFTKQAPEAVVAAQRNSLAETEEKLEKLSRSIHDLSA